MLPSFLIGDYYGLIYGVAVGFLLGLDITKSMIGRRIFSGIQPTGIPHIGNYFGAIRNWTKIQNEKDNDLVLFCIVDHHSTTSIHDPKIRKENIFQMLASLLACGIDTKKSLVFQQSRVPYHTELAWLLGCLAPIGQLKRMHQWKTKRSKEKELSNLGLFSYPVLMAADILLYKSTHVPVGVDQIQHIELTRDLSYEFNKRYVDTFKLPNAIFTETPRIMSLRKPTEKMSKSDINVNSRIEITDTEDDISNKIRKAVTDSEPYIDEIDTRAGVQNLVSVYSAVSGLNKEKVIDRYRGIQYFTSPMKNDLTQLVIDHFKPIRDEYCQLIHNRDYLESILIQGSAEAMDVASVTMKEIYCKIGMR